MAHASALPIHCASAWIRYVGHRSVPYSEDPDDALVAVHLVDDPVRTDAKRPEPVKTTSKLVARIRFAFQEAERLDDRVRQRPVEIDDLLAGPPGELNPAHLPLWVGELSAKFIERHGFPSLNLMTTFFDGSERFGIRKDLGGLFQGLVFVHGNKHSRGATPSSDDHVLSEVSNLIDHLAEFAS